MFYGMPTHLTWIQAFGAYLPCMAHVIVPLAPLTERAHLTDNDLSPFLHAALLCCAQQIG